MSAGALLSECEGDPGRTARICSGSFGD